MPVDGEGGGGGGGGYRIKPIHVYVLLNNELEPYMYIK